MRLLFYSPCLFFLIPFYSVLIFMNPNSASAQCSADQMSLLLQIKTDLVYNATLSSKLVKWNQSLDFCSWPGVKCLNRCVTDLDLSSEYISDGLTNFNSIFDLKHLQKLNLAYNEFTSTTIPSRFGDLTSLTYLNLSNAGFSGQIPIEISHLKQLVTLDFSTFYLLGTSLLKLENPNLGGLVQNLTRLSELYLDGVDLSSSGTTWGKVLSSFLPNLTVLSIPECKLLGSADDFSLARLRFLSHLRLDSNNLSALDPQVFAKFSHLVTFSAYSCELKGNFPAEVFQVQALQTLDLSDNPDLHGILPRFFRNNPLQILTLRNTDFTGIIPESIGELKRLSRLDIGQCNFHGPIPGQLWKLNNLVYIDLSFNRLNGSLQLFAPLVKLTVLFLPNNLLTGSITTTNWTELVQLENLDIRNNSFSGRIPTSLFGMKSLKKLVLSHNRFDGLENVETDVSPSVLDTLDLGSNNLQGPFPTFIFRLREIKILTMCFNNFSQAMNLSFIQNLRNLSSLDLSYNNLSIEAREGNFSLFPQLSTLKLASSNLKTFPDFLKYQSRLIYIDLSNNQIHHKIPKWIWDISTLSHLNLSFNSLDDFEDRNLTASLNVLDLRYNRLQGGLPSLPPSASYLDFSKNRFSSELPSEIGRGISYTYFLSLAGNYFRGKIPISVCNASYLQVLDLSNNFFNGDLPPCLSIMSQTLGVLNLGKNNFTGSISDSFMANCVLRTFDLSSNSIQGKLPKSLSKCSELEVLDLGNNRIDDTFPCWLKSISTLRVLVLRSNKLHGSIGCPDTTKTWAMLQIVDLACNKFSGSLDSDCLSTWKGMMTSNNDANGHLKYKVFEYGQLYYQDTVEVTFKGLQMELVKILTVFSSMDFSRNQLSGEIPDMIGNLTSLYVLNFSHNTFSSHIPASLGNLAQLESLDLSQNQLTGQIPDQLEDLTFLSVLNLSYNKLEGMIPNGSQFSTFSNSAYLGNKALCGGPLSIICTVTPPAKRKAPTANSGSFDWQFILTGVGFGVGSGTVVAPLVFWEKGKNWHDKQIEILLSHILQWFGLSHLIQDDQSEEKDEESESENEIDDEVAEDDAMITREKFCLYCSKIDITRKKVIHNPKCRCHESPPSSFTSSSSSSSSPLSLYQTYTTSV
ncbi:unnamed protein product [Rhodiola kirilowii]